MEDDKNQRGKEPRAISTEFIRMVMMRIVMLLLHLFSVPNADLAGSTVDRVAVEVHRWLRFWVKVMIAASAHIVIMKQEECQTRLEEEASSVLTLKNYCASKR